MRVGFALHAAFASSAKTSRYALSAAYSILSDETMAVRETMQVKKLSENAIMPVRGSEHAAGFDLASAYEATVPAGRQALVKTDLSIAIPPNTYARIAPRSGLAVKKMIDVGAGVVDYDYRGPVGVVLFNHGCEDFKVQKGDRVAQLILERICMADIEEVTELSETTRGSGGFGSTGVEQGALQTSSTVANGAKKIKVVGSEPVSRTSSTVARVLRLIDRVDKLDVDDAPTLVAKLRKAAMSTPSSLEDLLVGILENYDETGDTKALNKNLMAVVTA
ncbi:unnamed protein product [Ectocarpus sp. 4 AP-2014]